MPNTHEGYVSWEKAEAIRNMVSSNIPTSRHHGAPKHGDALLAGLLRCRRCGRKLTLRYSGAKHHIPRYSCTRGWMDNGEPRCIAFGGLRVDDAIEDALLTVVGPGAVAAAVAAEKEASRQRDQVRDVLQRDLETARYAADRAFRQYALVVGSPRRHRRPHIRKQGKSVSLSSSSRSRPFSSSSAFSRFASLTSMPPYLAFHCRCWRCLRRAYDAHHVALMTGWTLTQGSGIAMLSLLGAIGWLFRLRMSIGGYHSEQFTAASELLLAVAVTQETIVANTFEAFGQDMDEETPNELPGVQRH